MSEGNVIRENKMGTMPINKLLISMSLPMMISMLVQALYNVVDSIFVSQISENALTAVSLAFPVQNFMIAFGVGTGVGINALLSRSLGEKNFEEANKAANNGIFLAIISYFIFLIIGLLFSRKFFQWQTNISDIVEGGYSYLIIITTCSFGMYGQVVFEKLMQSTGKTLYSMITQLTGAIINIILMVCYVDIGLFFLSNMKFISYILIALAIFMGAICLYVYPILSRINAKTIDIFKISTRLVFKKLYITLTNISILIIGVAIVGFTNISLIAVLFGGSAVCYFILRMEENILKDVDAELKEKYSK